MSETDSDYGKPNEVVASARDMAKHADPVPPPKRRQPAAGRLPSLSPERAKELERGWDVRIEKKPFFSPVPRTEREPYHGPPNPFNRDFADAPQFSVAMAPPGKHRPALWDELQAKEEEKRRSASKEPQTAREPAKKKEKPPKENRSKSAPRRTDEDKDTKKKKKQAEPKPKPEPKEAKAPHPPKQPKKKDEPKKQPPPPKPATPSDNDSYSDDVSDSPAPAKDQKKKKSAKDCDPKHLIMADADDIKETFDRMDMNGNGYLSLAELDKGVIEIWPQFDNKPAIMRAYKATDKDGNGWVTRDEFPFFLQYIVYYNNLFELFEAVDDSDDRRVDKEEFSQCAPQFKMSQEEADEAFAEIDANGGGYILFDEFCAWFAKNKPNFDVELVTEEIDAEEEKNSHQPTTNQDYNPPRNEADKPPESTMTIEVPPREKQREIFRALDGNGSGKLSLAELDKGVIDFWPEFNNKPAIMRAYKAADKDGEGFVTRSEFEYFLRYIVYYNNLWSSFAEADDSGDRRLEKEEFINDAHKFDLTIAQAEAAFDEMDTNNGGMVLFDEFCAWMAKQEARPLTPEKPSGDSRNSSRGSRRSQPDEAPAAEEEAPAAEEEAPAAEEEEAPAAEEEEAPAAEEEAPAAEEEAPAAEEEAPAAEEEEAPAAEEEEAPAAEEEAPAAEEEEAPAAEEEAPAAEEEEAPAAEEEEAPAAEEEAPAAEEEEAPSAEEGA